VVVTLTTTVTELDPFRVVLPEETVQVEAAGAPLQVNATFPVNPPPGIMLKL
jgi:hypothetical protein